MLRQLSRLIVPLVPRTLQLATRQTLYPSLERSASIYSENQQRSEPGDVLIVLESMAGLRHTAHLRPASQPL